MFGFLRRERPPLAEELLVPPARALLLEDATALPLALELIDSLAIFEAISVPAADLVSNGRITKFFTDRRDPQAPILKFVNSTFTRGGRIPDAALFHFPFAREVFGVPEGLDEFNTLTYFTPGTKRYVAGVLHSYLLADAPVPVLGVQFYPQDVIAEQALLEVLREVHEALPLQGVRLAFVPTGSQQTTATITEDLAAAGIEVIPLDRILGAITYLPLNTGEAWGTLRVFPEDDAALRPDDIVVLDELPLDLSVVAGVMTRTVQDANSHVNLKSKERGTPNAVLRDASPEHPRLAPFLDLPVHLVIRQDDFLIEPTTAEIVAEKLAERTSGPLIPLRWEPDDRARDFAELRRGSAADALAASRRVGSKAANLAFLGQRDVLGTTADPGSPSALLGYDLVPGGAGVPFQHYADLVAHPPNTAVRAGIAAILAGLDGFSPAELNAAVTRVQAAFLAAEFPLGQLDSLRRLVGTALPGVTKLKVRSSSNAEDIPNFDGAGLHDSFSASLEKQDAPTGGCRVVEEADGPETKRKVKPKSLGCAVRGVYASQWNRRAIEERRFARIDQNTIAMGLAIVGAYDNESEIVANAVLLTRVLNTDAVYGYSLSIQQGNNLVTNPDPGTHTEVTIAAFISDDEPISFTHTRFAKPTREGPELTAPVLGREQLVALVELTKTVERAYCAAKPSYYPGPCSDVTFDNTKPRSLDLEVKVLADGRFIVKQVREFGGR